MFLLLFLSIAFAKTTILQTCFGTIEEPTIIEFYSIDFKHCDISACRRFLTTKAIEYCKEKPKLKKIVVGNVQVSCTIVDYRRIESSTNPGKFVTERFFIEEMYSSRYADLHISCK